MERGGGVDRVERVERGEVTTDDTDLHGWIGMDSFLVVLGV